MWEPEFLPCQRVDNFAELADVIWDDCNFLEYLYDKGVDHIKYYADHILFFAEGLVAGRRTLLLERLRVHGLD